MDPVLIGSTSNDVTTASRPVHSALVSHRVVSLTGAGGTRSGAGGQERFAGSYT